MTEKATTDRYPPRTKTITNDSQDLRQPKCITIDDNQNLNMKDHDIGVIGNEGTNMDQEHDHFGYVLKIRFLPGTAPASAMRGSRMLPKSHIPFISEMTSHGPILRH